MSAAREEQIDPAIFDPSIFDINVFNPNNIDPNAFVQRLNLRPTQLNQVLKKIQEVYVRARYNKNDKESKIKQLIDSHASLNKLCTTECPKCNNLVSMQGQIATLQAQIPQFSAQLRALENIEANIQAKIPIAIKAEQSANRDQIQANTASEARKYMDDLRHQIEIFQKEPSTQNYDIAIEIIPNIREIIPNLDDETKNKIVGEYNQLKHILEKMHQAISTVEPSEATGGKKRSKRSKRSKRTKRSKSRKTKSMRH